METSLIVAITALLGVILNWYSSNKALSGTARRDELKLLYERLDKTEEKLAAALVRIEVLESEKDVLERKLFSAEVRMDKLETERNALAAKLAAAEARIAEGDAERLLLIDDLVAMKDYAVSLRDRLLARGEVDIPEPPALKSERGRK